MATAESFSVTRAAAKASLSAHPAFPSIVVAWFAALLGGGVLILPVALLERLVAVTGVAALIPSAAAPLGETAHATIAVAGGCAGAIAGWAVVRRVAAQEPRPRRLDYEQGRPCRPISAHEELGEEGFASRIDTPVEVSVPPSEQAADGASDDGGPPFPTGAEPLDVQPAADDHAALADLGLMQLTARLSVALAQRRTQMARPPVTANFEAADADDAARAMAWFFRSSAGAEPVNGRSPIPMKNPLAPQQEFVGAAKPQLLDESEGNLRAACGALHRSGGVA